MGVACRCGVRMRLTLGFVGRVLPAARRRGGCVVAGDRAGARSARNDARRGGCGLAQRAACHGVLRPLAGHAPAVGGVCSYVLSGAPRASRRSLPAHADGPQLHRRVADPLLRRAGPHVLRPGRTGARAVAERGRGARERSAGACRRRRHAGDRLPKSRLLGAPAPSGRADRLAHGAVAQRAVGHGHRGGCGASDGPICGVQLAPRPRRRGVPRNKRPRPRAFRGIGARRPSRSAAQDRGVDAAHGDRTPARGIRDARRYRVRSGRRPALVHAAPAARRVAASVPRTVVCGGRRGRGRLVLRRACRDAGQRPARDVYGDRWCDLLGRQRASRGLGGARSSRRYPCGVRSAGGCRPRVAAVGAGRAGRGLG